MSYVDIWKIRAKDRKVKKLRRKITHLYIMYNFMCVRICIILYVYKMLSIKNIVSVDLMLRCWLLVINSCRLSSSITDSIRRLLVASMFILWFILLIGVSVAVAAAAAASALDEGGFSCMPVLGCLQRSFFFSRPLRRIRSEPPNRTLSKPASEWN